MKSFLHRILFITLVLPIGFLLVLEIIFRLFIQIIKWISFGIFDDNFIDDTFTWKIIEFLKFDTI